MERASFADSAASNSMEDSRIALDEKLLSKDGVGVIPDVDSPPNVTKKLSTDSGPTDSSSAPKSNPDSDTNTADDTPVYVSFASLSLKRDDDTISLASYQTCFDGIPESQEEENS
ncbi:hypothetical protein BDQ17DRAFT_351254 [Cyathus striatus]|nr:hypothetical protein BDQ17DRAFT_351254 [Cyathus striatus]